LRILVLSFYFPPDLSAGSFRIESLVNVLSEKISVDDKVDVITTHPHRYHSFLPKALDLENNGNISIKRIRLPAISNRFLNQIIKFIYFSLNTIRYAKHEKYDLVFVSSSRLLTAVLGTFIAKRQHAKLVVDIRDIFTQTIDSLYPSILFWPIKKVLFLLERYVIVNANKINLVSQGFVGYFTSKYSGLNISTYPNGIDELFVNFNQPNIHKKKLSTQNPLKILYTGNIGDGQALHKIIPAMAEKLQKEVNFTIIGDGNRRHQLKNEIDRRNITNITILPPMPRRKLVNHIYDTDILFLHLNNLEVFQYVLPSKIFEYAATGKPILAGVTGYAESFISQEIDNAQIFPPCNISDAISAFRQLNLETHNSSRFINQFSRKVIMLDFANEILSILHSPRPKNKGN